jgi:hypothetical protein
LQQFHLFSRKKILRTKDFTGRSLKDKENYFSVAEAVLRRNIILQRDLYKLKLIQGRSKEDVAYTRLFEDYHPGGDRSQHKQKFYFRIARFS